MKLKVNKSDQSLNTEIHGQKFQRLLIWNPELFATPVSLKKFGKKWSYIHLFSIAVNKYGSPKLNILLWLVCLCGKALFLKKKDLTKERGEKFLLGFRNPPSICVNLKLSPNWYSKKAFLFIQQRLKSFMHAGTKSQILADKLTT